MTTGPAVVAPSRRTVWRYAIGSLGTGGFSTLPGLVLLYYLTDTLAVPAAWAGAVIALVKIVDIVIDPKLGALSDRDRDRTGSRRRLMIIGALTLPVWFVIMFAAQTGLPPAAALAWVGIAFVGAAISFSLFQVPYIALPAEIGGSYDGRTTLLTWRVVVLSVAILIFGGGGPALRGLGGGGATGYLVMAVITGVIIGVGLLISTRAAAAAGGPADPAPAGDASNDRGRRLLTVVRQSRPLRLLVITFGVQAVATGLMLAGAQYVATYLLGDEDALTTLFVALIAPAVLTTPLWQRLARRTSKTAAYRLASVLFAIGCLGLTPMMVSPGPWVHLPVAVAGIAYAGLQAMPMAMLPDVITADRRRHGIDRGGVMGGIWTAVETAGFAAGGAVLAVVLSITGYLAVAGGTEQPASAVIGIAVSFSLIPAALVLLSLLALRGYRLGREEIDRTVEQETTR